MIKFTEPEIQVMTFEVEDVITTSGNEVEEPIPGENMPPIG